jgi:hypothetical protein
MLGRRPDPGDVFDQVDVTGRGAAPDTATSQVRGFIAQQPGWSPTVSSSRLNRGVPMANRSIILVTGLAASSLLLGGAMAGCSSNKSSTPSSSSASSSKQATAATSASSSASAEPSDYSTLLIKATDIVVPNDTFTAMPATPNPGGQPGVSGGFTNAAGNRVRTIAGQIQGGDRPAVHRG